MKAARQGLRLAPCSSRAVTHAREENSSDPARKHLSITSVVHGCLGFVSRWSMSLCAQAYSKACAQMGSAALRAALMSGAAELVLPGVVKWVPLSVRTVWTV